MECSWVKCSWVLIWIPTKEHEIQLQKDMKSQRLALPNVEHPIANGYTKNGYNNPSFQPDNDRNTHTNVSNDDDHNNSGK